MTSHYFCLTSLVLHRHVHATTTAILHCTYSAIAYCASTFYFTVLLLLYYVHALSQFGYTILTVAAQYNHVRLIEVMRRIPSVDINKKNSDGWCALIAAAMNGSVQALQALLADPRLDKSVRYFGSTAVSCARAGHNGDWEEAIAVMRRHGCPE